MARQLRLSKIARADLDRIWQYSAERYGIEHAVKYQTLLDQALDDIRADPERPSSKDHSELGPRVRSYRVALSKERSGTGIQRPPHVIFYTLRYPHAIVVMRILHELMDPGRHLLDE